jgi:hypothetical protein
VPGGLAAVEVTTENAAIVGGDYSLVAVDKETGVGITGGTISLLAPPEAIRIGGIMTLNPMAYTPLAPAFKLSPPETGLLALKNILGDYLSLIQGLGSIL